MKAARACTILACLVAGASAREVAGWNHAATPHFDIYSNSDAETARSLALGFERMHAFFVRQVGVGLPADREIRVICFASTQEYNQYRARPGADGYFIGAESRDYIVLPAVPRATRAVPYDDLRVAAHEYAHVLIHSGGWTLPEWIAEGIGDVVSTLRMGQRDSRIGGDLPGRSQALKSGKWMTLPELFAFTLKGPAAGVGREGLFYAQSWALADLLMLSPNYAARFPALLAALASGVPAVRALEAVYQTPLDAIARDLRARVARSSGALPLPAVALPWTEPRVEPMTPFASRAMLADLRLANGDLAGAASAFRQLAAESPASGEVHAALGTIALRRGDTAGAVAAWKRAVELGIADADLCFRYAVLAGDRDDRDDPGDRDGRELLVREALERAIALRPGFDDARFKLALLEKNAGRAEAAVGQLRAMRQIAPARAFAWWSALADALVGLDRRGEAKQAAAQAHAHAGSTAERERATELAWLADTELAVEIEGSKFRTVRVPVGAPERNPFIEAGDRVQRREATLRQVECSEGGIQIVVDSAQGTLTLAVPDPSRVQVRNAGSVAFEFVCGPQEARQVLVEYRPAGGILRGLEFR
jgi:tetratricopeptide (TPR) repeat protein